MKNSIHAVIFGIAIVTASLLIGNAYMAKYNQPGTILVTGLGEKNFESDLIIWEAKFEGNGMNLEAAYSDLDRSKNGVYNYLKANGVAAEDLAFSAVEIRKLTSPKYSGEGKYMGETFNGYQLHQTVEIKSEKVNEIEKISRNITELIHEGISVYSQAPRYYYTQLAQLKLEMISEATEDGRLRAEKIAQNAGGKLGNLSSAKMGVFQITGQNSKEDYSWGGTFNTNSKLKTASITMKLVYQIK